MLMSVLCGCQKNEQQDTSVSSTESVMTDLTLLRKILPGIDDIEASCWVEVPMGGSDFVGPTDYREVGYARLTESKAKELKETYTWAEVSFVAQMDGVDTSAFEDSQWKVCKDFTNSVMSNTYQGNVYFDGSTIWFDVITK